MNVIDLFSGVGGLSLGFEQNGFKVLFANEIDEKAERLRNPRRPAQKM